MQPTLKKATVRIQPGDRRDPPPERPRLIDEIATATTQAFRRWVRRRVDRSIAVLDRKGGMAARAGDLYALRQRVLGGGVDGVKASWLAMLQCARVRLVVRG